MKHLLWVLWCVGFMCLWGACTGGEQPEKEEPRLPDTPSITPSTPSDSTSSNDSTITPSSIIDISKVNTKLCNSNASQPAQNLYAKMLSVYGKNTFSGITECNITSNDFSNAIFSLSGKYPAIVNYQIDSINSADFSDLSKILLNHSQNRIVAISWNWLTPSSQSDNPQNYAIDSQFSIANALIDKTWEFKFLIQDLEKVAKLIDKLRQADIPVIFSPLNSNKPNSWWTRATPLHFTELWKLIYDQLAVRHQLNNIIWVWTANTESFNNNDIKDWYPGKKYIDLVGVNTCQSTQNTHNTFQQVYTSTAGTHMLAISACNTIPDPDKALTNGDIWLYFNVLSAQNNPFFYNSIEYWSYIISHKSIITSN